MRMTGYGASGGDFDFFAFDSDGDVWDGSAFVEWVDANFASYRIAPTLAATIGGEDRFEADAPDGTVRYELRFRGATAALSYLAWESSVWASQASVDALAALFAGGTVTVTSPVANIGGRTVLTIVRGDSYESGSIRGPIEITAEAVPTWPDLSTATVTLTVRVKRAKGDATDPAVVLTSVGTVTQATGDDRVFSFPPTAAETAAALVGLHEFDVQIDLGGGNVATLGPGLPCYVVADQTV